MIVKTFDGKEYYASKEQADKIAQAISSGTKMIFLNGNYIAAGAIATISRGGIDPNQKTLPPPEVPEISPEKRAENVKKLAEIRQKHFGIKA